MVERIRKRLNLTTLQDQRFEDLVAAIGLPAVFSAAPPRVA
jgi:hypothetical protein